MDKPELSQAKFVFTQDGNTLGTTDDTEILEIHIETQGDDPFVVLKTETGWSIDSMDELNALAERCKAVFNDSSTPKHQ
jgi:hypothetical protein